MEKQFIQFRSRSAKDTTKVDTIILRTSVIECIVPSNQYEGGCAIHCGDGLFESPDSLEYFQNLLKPLGWEQK